MLLNKRGYTLAQMLIVLCVISIVFFLLPIASKKSYTHTYEMEKVRDLLVFYQQRAIYDKKRVVLVIENYQILDKTNKVATQINLDCGYHEISFNQRGNVNQARTVTCSSKDKTGQIIINLGNGNVYVK